MANVFVSHRGADSADAARLATELRAHGHTVWLDAWEIGVGDSIVAKMNQGLEGATFLVLCYSALGVTSPWMSREWMAALARQLQGHNVKIIPVYLTGSTGPAIIADVRAADLQGDWTNGIAEILRALAV